MYILQFFSILTNQFTPGQTDSSQIPNFLELGRQGLKTLQIQRTVKSAIFLDRIFQFLDDDSRILSPELLLIQQKHIQFKVYINLEIIDILQ